jgi:hypothetical protein
MVPAHARGTDEFNCWSAKTDSLPNGVLLAVMWSDPKVVARIRGLADAEQTIVPLLLRIRPTMQRSILC